MANVINKIEVKSDGAELNVSAVQQEYLAEAYRLMHYQNGDPYISTSDLADVIGVSPAAVSGILERLKKSEYIEHTPYKGMKLTPKGERVALMNIRRHRLAEVFLVKVMGFGWHEVHDQADAMGAVISEVVAARMEKMAGNPTRCPHGEPIPTADGVMPAVRDEPLSDVSAPADLIISRVHTHDPELLQYIQTLSLMPGTTIRLISRAPFNGPLRLKLDQHEQVIGYELAKVLRVSKNDT